MSQKDGIQSIIERLKKRGPSKSTNERRAVGRPRRKLRRPFYDGVQMALEVVDKFGKELEKIR